MLTEKTYKAVAKLLESMMVKAEIVLDEKVVPISILRTEISKDGRQLKVYTRASSGDGQVTNLRILDSEGDIVLERPKLIQMHPNYGLISTFWIEIGEREVQSPISIFEQGGK